MEEGFKNKERMTFEHFITVLERVGGKSAGAVRVSLGLASDFSDVYRFLHFARNFLDKDTSEV